MNDVFLSYAREDQARAQRLAAALEAQGWKVWWDRHIATGKTFDEVIQKALDNTRSVVVLWSESSIRSNWVKEEASAGAQREILVPCRIDDVRIPLGFGRIQTASLIGWEGEPDHPGLRDLFAALTASIEATTARATARVAIVPKPAGDGRPLPLCSPPAPATAAPAAWRRFRAPLLGALAAGILGAGLVAYISRGDGGARTGEPVVGAVVPEPGGAEDEDEPATPGTVAPEPGGAVVENEPAPPEPAPPEPARSPPPSPPVVTPDSGEESPRAEAEPSAAGSVQTSAESGQPALPNGAHPPVAEVPPEPAAREVWVSGLTFSEAVRQAGGGNAVDPRASSRCNLTSEGDALVAWVRSGATGNSCHFRLNENVRVLPDCRIVGWDYVTPGPNEFRWVHAPEVGTETPRVEVRLWANPFRGQRRFELRKVQLSVPQDTPTSAAGERALLDAGSLAARCLEAV